MKTDKKVFQILDLDRTLLDTSKLAHLLKDIISKYDQQLSTNIHTELLQHHKSHTSFFIFEYIVNKVGDQKFQFFIDELYASVTKQELLLPGAKKRIAYAKSKPGWAMGIMTYGSQRDQMIKLKLVGLHHEHVLVINTPNKGEIIASWQQTDGTFKLPIEFGGHRVDIVTLDDDKYIAFEHLPSNAFGQWVSQASLGGSTELPYIPDNIRVVSNLDESVGYLKTQLK